MKELIKKMVLQKLVRENMWGGKHTPLTFIKKGIPELYRNTHQGRKTIEEALRQLISQEWILIPSKRTGKGGEAHISLNPRKVAEIKQFLETFSKGD